MSNSRKHLIILFFSLLAISISANPPIFAQIESNSINSKSSKTEMPNSLSCETLSDKYVVLNEIMLDDFINAINSYGKCGYRVAQASRYGIEPKSTERKMMFFAVLERNNPSQFEYAWFIAYTPGEAQTLANKYAAENLYFRLKFSFKSEYSLPGTDEKDSTIGGISGIGSMFAGTRGAFFLFERKVGSPSKKEYRVLDSIHSGSKKDLAENNKKLNDLAVKGFRPLDLWATGLGIENFVIVEKDEAIKPEGEYLMIYKTFNLENKLNELGREGFEPISIGFVSALLQRTTKSPTNKEYDEIQTWKDIEKGIPKWKESGMTYIDTGISEYYWDFDPFDGRWLFEVPQKKHSDYGKNKDFVFLRYNSIAEDYYKTHGLKPTEKNPLTLEQRKEILNIFSKKINDLNQEDYQLITVNCRLPISLVILFVK